MIRQTLIPIKAMETKQQILKYLVDEPRFRERSCKLRGIADVLIQKYQLDIDRRKLADILKDGETMNRMWRQLLQEREDLRGSDYGEEDGTKVALEQNKKLELGYEPNYQETKSLFNA